MEDGRDPKFQVLLQKFCTFDTETDVNFVIFLGEAFEGELIGEIGEEMSGEKIVGVRGESAGLRF